MDLQWLAIIPILSLLMLVHELGHFITARRAGVVVQEFGFGLPPRIVGYEYRELDSVRRVREDAGRGRPDI